jgi:hypothetical protein
MYVLVHAVCYLLCITLVHKQYMYMFTYIALLHEVYGIRMHVCMIIAQRLGRQGVGVYKGGGGCLLWYTFVCVVGVASEEIGAIFNRKLPRPVK